MAQKRQLGAQGGTWVALVEGMTEQEREHKEFIGAAAAVYAWVSAADGEISKVEIRRFVDYLGELDYVDEITDDDFNEYYLTLLEAFHANFDDGMSRAQTRIEVFSGNQEKASDLLRIARRALIADEKLNDAEEEAILEIATLLNLNEDLVSEV